MQQQLATARPEGTPQILGVNAPREESGNADMVYRRTIPLLQDTGEQDVWGRWGVTNRDVIVLDSLNHPVAVYNLTEHNLANPVDFDSLKALLLRIAG